MARDFKNKNVMIVGAQTTGASLAKFLHQEGAKITISDSRTREKLGTLADQLEEFDPIWDLGGHSAKAMTAQDLIIFSPGVNHNDRVFEPARARGIPMVGELELAASLIEEPIIAVTGTNGKSTVTKMVYEMLSQSGVKAWIGGNFGLPLIEYVTQKEKADVLVVEVSSFQLETVENFKPQFAILLNLAEDHLDRYKGGFSEYASAKKRMFKNFAQECTAVLNADDNVVIDFARDPVLQRGTLLYFSRRPVLEEQISKIGGCVYQAREIKHYSTTGQVTKFSVSHMKMRGKFAIDNCMAAIMPALHYGAKPEVIQNVIKNFPGLEHRLEFVKKKGGVDFYNDSKSTNVHSVMGALEAFDDPVILIAGGKDKGVDFAPLADLVHAKVKNLILVGEAKERLNRTIGDYSETFIIGTFDEAVYLAYQKSRSGDIILLSPGCSSYDMFENFEERGNYFKKLVQKL